MSLLNLKFYVTGDPIGFFSAPLKQMAGNIEETLYSDDYLNELTWLDLYAAEFMVNVAFNFLYFLLTLCSSMGHVAVT